MTSGLISILKVNTIALTILRMAEWMSFREDLTTVDSIYYWTVDVVPIY